MSEVDMLPKAAQKIEYTLFKEPGAFNRPVYMWCWNSPINCERLKAELSRLKKENAGGVMIVPEPAYFRPETMKTTLSPDYLTPEYLKIYRETAAEAKRLGLKLWFYDEGGWPSGSACGKVTKARPDLAAKRLIQTVKPVKKGDRVPDEALCSNLLTKERKISLKCQKTAPEDGELYCVHADTQKSGLHPVYPDLLNADTANAFIEIGCEPYMPYIGELARDIVPLLFTDEPTAANPPWGDDFPELFKEKYGYDIKDRLNELFETGEESAQTRIDYFDFWSALLAKRYFKKMRVWSTKTAWPSPGI